MYIPWDITRCQVACYQLLVEHTLHAYVRGYTLMKNGGIRYQMLGVFQISSSFTRKDREGPLARLGHFIITY